MNIFKVIFMGLLLSATFSTEASAITQRYIQGTTTPITGDPVSTPNPWLSNPCTANERMTQGHLSSDFCHISEPSTSVLPFLATNDCAQNMRAIQGSLVCEEINYPPHANAGVPQEVSTGSPVHLNGSASYDVNSGDTLTYSWQFISKPTGSTAILAGANTLLPSFTAELDGVYHVQLTVTDGTLSSVDEVNITATSTLPPDTTPPVITLNGNSSEVILAGTVFEDPGAIALDNRDGSLNVSTYGYVNTFMAGTYIRYYTATDSAGNYAEVSRTINVFDTLSLVAINDIVTSQTIQEISVDVLSNDTHDDPSVRVALDTYPDTQGTWQVTGNQVVFTPNAHFGGGEVHAQYRLIDNFGHTATADIQILYPVIFQAKDDTVNSDTITQVTVAVLNNDTTIEGSPVSIKLKSFEGYTSPIITEYDGIWEVIDDSVSFTPNANYHGGKTNNMEYEITDSSGHISSAKIQIIYPNVIQAISDEKIVGTIGTVDVDVLANDIFTDTPILDVYVDSWGFQPGTWTVVNNKIRFTPNPSFGGGSVYAEYSIRSLDNMWSYSVINITYPILFQANTDEQRIADINETAHMDVLSNDITVEGIPTTVEFISWDNNTGNQIFVNSITTEDGEWTLIDNNVTFTPNQSFSGGDIYMQYRITDTQGHESRSSIRFYYPNILLARTDRVRPATLEEITIDVLNNDSYSTDTTVNVMFTLYDDQTEQMVSSNTHETEDGNWTVEADEVLFTPKTTFGGGYVSTEYQITDQNGHISSTSITINYPVILRANYDSIVAMSRDPFTIPVLDNDTIAEGSVVTVKLKVQVYNQSTGEWEYQYLDSYESYEGNWTIVADEVQFTPNEAWDGRYVNMNYQIENQDGIKSSTSISVELPVSLYAEYDSVTASEITQTVTIPVLDNDTAIDGKENLTLQLQYQDENWTTVYGTSYTNDDGTWNVTDTNTIEFIPSATFGGGYVSVSYQITDLNGRTSETGINIEYPQIVYAEYDEIYPNALAPETIDVLSNDTYNQLGDVTVMLEHGFWDGNNTYVTEYVTSLEEWDGNWTVTANNEIHFIPNANFTGTYVSRTYQIVQDGRTSTTSVSITYPIIIQAQSDYAQATDIGEIYVDVLNNDTIVNGLDRLEFIDWNQGGIMVTSYETAEGNWSITVGNEVSFIPSSTFGGGYVSTEYQITDQNGHISSTSITINYPVILRANYDSIVAMSRDPFTIPVLDNDTIAEGSVVTVKLKVQVYNQSTGEWEYQYLDNYESYEGNWTVTTNDEVFFTPDPQGTDTYASMYYNITNQDGIKSSASISVELPL